jgi:nifR3 family TIM-barrel protein
MSYTEFVNAMDVLQKRPPIEHKLAYLPKERPVVFQLFDDDPDRLVQAALKLRSRNPDIIDVNMGCSARTVSGRGAGAGLLRTPEKIATIFQKLTAALDIPVTGKIRLGWDAESLNYRLVARTIEENGGALIAVHGRTRSQGYGGRADWDAIAEVKQSVSIPVIGNGDVRTAADIERLKVATGCQAVMIGRGAIGNPWIFSRLDREQVPPEEVRRTVLLHLERMESFYDPEYSLVLFRKHLAQYISPYPLDPDFRKRLMTATGKREFIDLLDGLITSAQSFT